MPSQYIVCQFGNVMTGEYLNIGVYTYDMDKDKPQVYSKFLEDWSRVNTTFGLSGDKCADSIMASMLNNWLKKIDSRETLLQDIKNASSPYSSLLFTQPRASLLPAQELLDDVAKTFLVE